MGTTGVPDMSEPQPILDPLTPAALFLVATIRAGGEEKVRGLLEDLPGLRRSVGFRLPGADLSCITGIGAVAWDRLFTGPRPAELHKFPGYTGPRHHAPATPGDLLFHIRAQVHDACFELAMAIADRLGDAVTFVDETVGFRYFEQRDLLGFVDGTENPEGVTPDSPAGRAVFIGDEDPDFRGGSYVIVQKYLHDMSAWRALPVPEQERVIGRTKLEDFEFAEDDKPADSHIAMAVVVEPDGTERQILRANMPFGSIRDGEFGTYFIGYSATPRVTEIMLERMFLGTDEASHDRILDFSTAVTGSLFFVPAQNFFEELPDSPGTADLAHIEESGRSAPSWGADGSLGIGTLKRSTSV